MPVHHHDMIGYFAPRLTTLKILNRYHALPNINMVLDPAHTEANSGRAAFLTNPAFDIVEQYSTRRIQRYQLV
ncbi:MAG: hypothetical protein HRT36_00045 [Alphaproteobacteria bacterium]|nr:hypothetical protein [Alphaproteobacteria bacterium]